MGRYRTYTQEDDQPLIDGDAGWTGVNMRMDPRLLGKGIAAAAVNTRFRNGVPEPRQGCVKLPSFNKLTSGSVVVQPFGQIWGAGEFNDPNDAYYEILAADGGVFKLRSGNSPSALTLPPMTTINYPVFILQAFNDLLMFRGEQLAPLVLTDFEAGFTNLTDGVDNFLYATAYAENAEILFPPNCGFAWNLSQAYAPGDIVLYTDGNHYLNTIAAAAGQGPMAAPGSWLNLNWSAGQSYATKAYTVYEATLFQAELPAQPGQDPLNFPNIWVPVKSQLWEKVGSGVTTAGDTPLSNPAEWDYVRDFIPYSSFAYFYQNRVWIVHSRDLVAVSDVLDYNVYVPQVDELRINQGSADALVCLYKYNDTTLFAFKEQSVYIISNITGDLSSIQLDELTREYGIAGPKCVTMCGQDLWFLSNNRGITSFTQTELNQIHGADKPVSEAIQPLIDRINWNASRNAQLIWDNNYLYAAVPLDSGAVKRADGTTVTRGNIIPAGAQYFVSTIEILIGFPTPLYFYNVPVIKGQTYSITGQIGDVAVYNPGVPLPSTVPDPPQIAIGGQTVTLVAQGDILTLQANGFTVPSQGTTVTAVVEQVVTAVNNAVIVYDFFTGQWAGYDQGEAISPLAFFRNIFNGATRLFFVAADGYVNLYGDGSYDMVRNPGTASGLAAAQIEQSFTTRAYLGTTLEQKKITRYSLQVDTWNPDFTLTAIWPGQGAAQTLLDGVTRSRTKYIRPFNAPPYVPDNSNFDHDAPGREDYSVDLSVTPTRFDQGLTLGLLQEATFRGRMRGNAPQVQFVFANVSGMAKVRNLEVEANPGSRREGVL